MTGTLISHSGTAEHGRDMLTRLCLAVFLLVIVVLPGTTWADVSAKYTRSNGSELAVSISVTPPAPSSIILIHKLPTGVRLVRADPPVNNVNNRKGVAKWLIREVAPGSHTIRLFLNREVTAEEISASIRYKPASGGGMKTQPVAKP